MKTICERSLATFEFWSGGGKDRAMMLTYEEMEMVEEVLEDIYPDGIDETTLNDLFWFDFEWVCESIGLQYDAEEDEVIRN